MKYKFLALALISTNVMASSASETNDNEIVGLTLMAIPFACLILMFLYAAIFDKKDEVEEKVVKSVEEKAKTNIDFPVRESRTRTYSNNSDDDSSFVTKAVVANAIFSDDSDTDFDCGGDWDWD